MRKFLGNLLLTSAISAGSLFFGCLPATRTFVYTNYENPEKFYIEKRPEREESSGDSEIIATIGSVLGVMADNRRDVAIGAALSTYGGLMSNKEASREGRTEINITQGKGEFS